MPYNSPSVASTTALKMHVKLNACSSTDCYQHLPAHPATLLWTVLTYESEYVDIYKYLGAWLYCKLSFQTHIKHLQSKIKSRIVFLFRNKASFTHAAKHTLVKLTILPILNLIYKIASNTLLSKCDAVYHSAICFVTKSPYTTTTATCMLSLAGRHFIFVANTTGSRSSIKVFAR
jgi:hypothetical protein